MFKPYVLREINGVPVAIIGQAFPYTPIANPRYSCPTGRSASRRSELQKIVDEARAKGAQVVVLLSHNGMDVDLKLAVARDAASTRSSAATRTTPCRSRCS